MDNKIKIPRKNSKTIASYCQLATVDQNNNVTYSAYDLTGYTAALGVKERKDSKTYAIYIVGVIDTPPTTGIITFDFADTDTDLQPKKYLYDIKIENSGTGDRQNIVENGEFEIVYSITYEEPPN